MGRTISLKFIFLFLSLISIAQLMRLQIFETKKWKSKAELRDVVSIKTEGQRGSLNFRDGNSIAYDKEVFRVFLNPESLRNSSSNNSTLLPEEIYILLSKYTNLTEAELKDAYKNSKNRRVLVTKDLVEKEFLEVWELFSKYPNLLSYDQLFTRVYPNKTLASKAIGFVGYDDSGKRIGRYGVEEYFDGVLKGTAGVIEGKKDQRGNLIIDERFDSVRPKDGINLNLTLEQSIQQIMDTQMLYWFDQFKAVEATAVAIEPNTGRILGITNYPTYDPNIYYDGEQVFCEYEYYVLHKDCNQKREAGETKEGDIIADKEKYDTKKIDRLPENVVLPDGYTEEDLREILKEIDAQRLVDLSGEIEEQSLDESRQEEEGLPEIDERIKEFPEIVQSIFREEDVPIGSLLRNTPNSYLYEPGSVIKAFTLAVAYELGTLPFDPDFQLGGHNGCVDIADREICTANKRPRSSLSTKQMIIESDNIGALRVAQTIPRIQMVEKFKELGLGELTGVEMADENQFRVKPSVEWSEVDQATAAFGQGSVSYTPIQLVSSWNILASEGKKYKPTLIYSKDDGQETKIFQPVFQGQVLSPKVVQAVSEITASDPSYNGALAKEFFDKYSYAGKTGTASIPKVNGVGYEEGVVNTTFVGHAPLDHPKVTLLVWFREPRISYTGSLIPNASDTALVAWIDMMERILVSKGVKPNSK